MIVCVISTFGPGLVSHCLDVQSPLRFCLASSTSSFSSREWRRGGREEQGGGKEREEREEGKELEEQGAARRERRREGRQELGERLRQGAPRHTGRGMELNLFGIYNDKN